ncbi:hypothetical protein [Chryseobacterium taklimakanense]|uniref:hypothetical protein n=1 Tax=Chryseobacterium taklimakanense TaxID=536441 RepID=UPI0012FDE098|nr:hypothetical protein [Chryseobacterium taklimakanense]
MQIYWKLFEDLLTALEDAEDELERHTFTSILSNMRMTKIQNNYYLNLKLSGLVFALKTTNFKYYGNTYQFRQRSKNGPGGKRLFQS